MAGRNLLVVSPRADLLGSLVFSLEAEGYSVTGRAELPGVEWLKAQHFDACVVDQRSLDREHFDAIGFCILAHPVILIAEKLHPFLHEWVSQVVVMPDNAELLTTALRELLQATGSELPLS